MYRNWASAIVGSSLSWLLLALCVALVWTSLGLPAPQNGASLVYVCSASVLGALAIRKGEFAVPAYMMLVIGALNLLISSSSPGAVKYSNVLAPVSAGIAYALLLVGIWKPLRLTKSSFPLPSPMRERFARTVLATSLALFVPLGFLIVTIMLNQTSQMGSSATLLSWNAYMYALFFTGFSYGVAALIWVWPPSVLSAKDLFRPQILLLFVATLLASAYFENLLRNSWTAFVFSQMGVFGTLTIFCHIRLHAGDTALNGSATSDRAVAQS